MDQRACIEKVSPYKNPLEQAWQNPVLEGLCPETFKCDPAATHLKKISRSLEKLYRT